MRDLLKKAKFKAGDLVTSVKEMRPDAGEIKHAADFLVDAASKTATEAGRLGKDALKTDMAKDAAAGAAIGAAVAVPIPLVGPIAGAVVGAGLGVYKNIKQSLKTERPEALPNDTSSNIIDAESKIVPSLDKFEELSKLHDLKVKGILTEDEFAAEKKKVLDR
jgi:Short C-terminal domain